MRADRQAPTDPSASSPTEPDWRAAIALRWQALGLELLGVGPTPRRTLVALGHECQALAAVVAWFETQGNVMHAAARLRTSPRTLREHIEAWRRRNPDFTPALPEGRHRRGSKSGGHEG